MRNAIDYESLRLKHLKTLPQFSKKGGSPSKLTTAQVDALFNKYSENPNQTIDMLLEWNFAQTGVRISRQTFYRIRKLVLESNEKP
jgi:hypothetical protein